MHARWFVGLGFAIVLGCADDGGTDTGGGTESMGMTASATTMSGSATTQSSDSDTGTGEGSSSGAATSDATTSNGSTTSSEDTMSSDSSSMCSNDGESCTEGQDCCVNLTCCVGLPVPPGEEYCSISCPDSDRNLKDDFASVDPHDVLSRVAALPITTWTYKTDPSGARHLGPMAQDFKAAFDLGATDRAIHKIDADGVALAAIQALHTELQAARAENADLRARVTALEARL